MIRLISVPHTGTRFTGKVLDALGFPMGERTEHHTDDLGFPTPYVNEGGPVVVPIRDPMLAEISRKNRLDSGLPVQEWAKVAEWVGRENVHFFRLDGPGRRSDEVQALADFLGVPAVWIDWTPVATSNDKTGFKARYLAGEVPKELRRQFDWLHDNGKVVELFRHMGYRLPWMPTVALEPPVIIDSPTWT